LDVCKTTPDVVLLQAVNLRPKDARAHTNLGAILHLLGQTQQATLSYKAALNLQPGDPTTIGNLKKLGATEDS
jgi:protein O-mannosyl-transferase